MTTSFVIIGCLLALSVLLACVSCVVSIYNRLHNTPTSSHNPQSHLDKYDYGATKKASEASDAASEAIC